MPEPVVSHAWAPPDIDPGLLATTRWDELLVAAGRGEEASFELLAHEVRGLLRLRALRVVNDSDDADEVVQEVLLEAWRNAHRYDAGRGRALTWLSHIVRHRAIDLVRRTAARRLREEQVTVRSAMVDFDHTLDTVLTLADQNRVRTALRCLTSLQQEAIGLVYFEGMTATEAASRLCVPLPTLKTRLRDGISRLRVATASPDREEVRGATG